jgi:hypothetical protein
VLLHDPELVRQAEPNEDRQDDALPGPHHGHDEDEPDDEPNESDPRLGAHGYQPPIHTSLRSPSCRCLHLMRLRA